MCVCVCVCVREGEGERGGGREGGINDFVFFPCPCYLLLLLLFAVQGGIFFPGFVFKVTATERWPKFGLKFYLFILFFNPSAASG